MTWIMAVPPVLVLGFVWFVLPTLRTFGIARPSSRCRATSRASYYAQSIGVEHAGHLRHRATVGTAGSAAGVRAGPKGRTPEPERRRKESASAVRAAMGLGGVAASSKVRLLRGVPGFAGVFLRHRGPPRGAWRPPPAVRRTTPARRGRARAAPARAPTAGRRRSTGSSPPRSVGTATPTPSGPAPGRPHQPAAEDLQASRSRSRRLVQGRGVQPGSGPPDVLVVDEVLEAVHHLLHAGPPERHPAPAAELLDQPAEVASGQLVHRVPGQSLQGSHGDAGGGDRTTFAHQQVADQHPGVPRVAQGGGVRAGPEGGVAQGQAFTSGEGGHVDRA